MDFKTLVNDATKNHEIREPSNKERVEDNWRRVMANTFYELRFFLRQKKASTGLTQKAIAEYLEKDEGLVSRALSGNKNVTVRTLADIAFAAGFETKIHFVPKAAAQNNADLIIRGNGRSLAVLGTNSPNTERKSSLILKGQEQEETPGSIRFDHQKHKSLARTVNA